MANRNEGKPDDAQAGQCPRRTVRKPCKFRAFVPTNLQAPSKPKSRCVLKTNLNQRPAMNKTTFAVLTSAMLIATGSAFAQDAAKRAEEIKSSSEMMRPPTSNSATTTAPSPATPLSAADQKAEDARRSSEMMKPQTNAPAAPAGNSMAAPSSAADQKAAAEQSRSEMMKPK
jgi:hypothetical protein